MLTLRRAAIEAGSPAGKSWRPAGAPSKRQKNNCLLQHTYDQIVPTDGPSFPSAAIALTPFPPMFLNKCLNLVG